MLPDKRAPELLSPEPWGFQKLANSFAARTLCKEESSAFAGEVSPPLMRRSTPSSTPAEPSCFIKVHRFSEKKEKPCNRSRRRCQVFMRTHRTTRDASGVVDRREFPMKSADVRWNASTALDNIRAVCQPECVIGTHDELMCVSAVFCPSGTSFVRAVCPPREFRIEDIP